MLRKYQVLQNNISNIIINLAHIYKIPGAAYAGEPQHVANGSTKPFSGFDDNPKSMILIFWDTQNKTIQEMFKSSNNNQNHN